MTTTALPVERPEWMEGWQPETRKLGNPSWHRGMKSPNPAGRPRGIVDKRVRVAQQMLDDVQGIVEVMTAKALEGDASAASLILARVLPSLRPQTEKVAFNFDPAAPVSRQVEMVLEAIADGRVSADTGKQIIEAIGTLASARAVEDLEQRIAQLEERQT